MREVEIRVGAADVGVEGDGKGIGTAEPELRIWLRKLLADGLVGVATGSQYGPGGRVSEINNKRIR